MRSTRRNEQGSAMIICAVTAVIMAALAATYLAVAGYQSRSAMVSIEGERLLHIADMAIGRAAAEIVNDIDPDGDGKGILAGALASDSIRWSTQVTANADGSFRVVAVAESATGEIKAIEAFVGITATEHDLINKAVYAGNRSGDTNYEFKVAGNSTTNRDIITGDIHINGKVKFANDGSTNGQVTGKTDATSGITGTNEAAVGHTENGAAPPIPPPDLKAMKYEDPTFYDFKIGPSEDASMTTKWNSGKSSTFPSTDPRHVFAKDFRSDLYDFSGAKIKFSNNNYFFGDYYAGSNLDKVSIDGVKGNNALYFVDGNLWMEPQGATQTILDATGTPTVGTVITVVVKGNIYFNDTFNANNTKDGFLFIALADGESYTDLDGDHKWDDLNGNGAWDPGDEPLLNDDGDGLYEGNVEGSGNVYFGDTNGNSAALNPIDAFVYAENNFEDLVQSNTGTKFPFQVNGFLSAGETLRINRGADFSGHSYMRVAYDNRIQTGALKFKGFPEKATTSTGPTGIATWRTIAPPWRPFSP